MKKLLIVLLSVLLLASFVAGCTNNTDTTAGTTDNVTDTKGTSPDPNKTIIRIGASADAIPLVDSGVSSLEAMGYEVEVVTFDDFFVPNVSLDEGSIDANFYQHEVFLNNYNSEKGTNIVMLDPSMYNYFLGFYAKDVASVDELPEGGKIGIANDAANIDQFLRVMDKWGIIGLTDEQKDLYGTADIVDNPKNFELVQLDYTQRCAAYDGGDLAAMVCASNTMFMAGLNPTENLFFDEVDNDYALGICINANTYSLDDQWVQDMMTAYTSNEAYQYVLEYYQGAYRNSEGLDELKGN